MTKKPRVDAVQEEISALKEQLGAAQQTAKGYLTNLGTTAASAHSSLSGIRRLVVALNAEVKSVQAYATSGLLPAKHAKAIEHQAEVLSLLVEQAIGGIDAVLGFLKKQTPGG